MIQVKLNTKSKPNAQGLFAFVCFSNVADVTKVLQAVVRNNSIVSIN